jgi:hypothetical protein
LGLSVSSPRPSKIKLFKPDNSKNQAFQAWPKKLKLKDLSWFLFLQLKLFLFNQIKKKCCFFRFYLNLKYQAFQA